MKKLQMNLYGHFCTAAVVVKAALVATNNDNPVMNACYEFDNFLMEALLYLFFNMTVNL